MYVFVVITPIRHGVMARWHFEDGRTGSQKFISYGEIDCYLRRLGATEIEMRKD